MIAEESGVRMDPTRRAAGVESKVAENAYLGDIALLDHKIPHIEWTVTAKHELFQRGTGSGVDQPVFSEERIEIL